MPKIFLKPNSPEFDDGREKKRPPGQRCCDMPDCNIVGEYRAPKNRGLSDYYWFCLPHVQEYNKAWNYFSGMSMADVEDYINTASVWDRPTRRYDSMGATTEALKQRHGKPITSQKMNHNANARRKNSTIHQDRPQSLKHWP